jgi:large subunit ribosomal protein L22
MYAKLKLLRISPRKVRLVAKLIRGKQVNEALAQLDFVIKRAALPLSKLLRSAIANAKNNFNIPAERLYIDSIIVNEGQRMKRQRPRAKGRAYRILRKTSHISITLKEKKDLENRK